jgi:hypothetical protein
LRDGIKWAQNIILQYKAKTKMNLIKNKPIRLKGRKLQDLHIKVYELDGGVDCLNGEPIPEGTPAHHVNHGKNKEDRKENMCMLGTINHHRAHFKDVKAIKRLCKEYLRRRDGENKWNM